MLGRATGVQDRAHRSALAYDARGNVVWTARQLAYLPDAPALVPGPARTQPHDDRPSWTEAPIGANRYVTYSTSRTYVREAAFDHAGRGTALVLPRDFEWGPGEPTIGGTLTYNHRGLRRTASVTIGCDPVTIPSGCTPSHTQPVARDIEYERDGLPRTTHWGVESLGTSSTTRYDIRRRPVRMTTTRSATGSGLQAVSTVVDQQFVWDAASNLTELVDHRDPSEWPAGHRPQSTYVMHDALYRVISASFSYTQESGRRTTADAPTDWREAQARIRGDYPAEGAGPNADPMRVRPAPMLQDPEDVPGRVIDLEWHWDWLGNTTRWDDDAQLFYERSIGAIQNGADRPSDDLRPSALYIATNLPSTGALSPAQEQRAGWTELTYGEGGNVTELTVHGRCSDRAPSVCTDLPAAAPSARAAHLRAHCECAHEQHYEYRWDELNRLAEARRWDREAASGPWTLEVRQRYRYDAGNVRMVKATIEPSAETAAGTPGDHDERIALYVYPGDYEIRGLERAVGSNSYIAGTGLHDRVETQYVVAGARLVWRNVSGSELTQARHRRLTVPLTDIIQTTAATLDLLDGDLVEASTHYPNGARATLLIDEDDPSATEPSGFTGKEGDDEVGVTYFGERYLVARLGRWASPDPLHVHQAGGGEALNAYHYVAGNILQGRDPLGLCDEYMRRTVGAETCARWYADTVWMMGMTPNDLTQHEQSQLQRRATLAFFKIMKPDPVAGRLLERYAEGSGMRYRLDATEVAHIGGPGLTITGQGRGDVDPSVHRAPFEEAYARAQEAGGRAEIDIVVPQVAAAAGTLGQYSARFIGTLEVTEGGDWAFEGEVEFIDTYNFDPREWGVRDVGPELQTRVAAALLPGTGFDVSSDRVAVSQQSGQRAVLAVPDTLESPGNGAGLAQFLVGTGAVDAEGDGEVPAVAVESTELR